MTKPTIMISHLWWQRSLCYDWVLRGDSPKVIVFCAIAKSPLHVPFHFDGNATGGGLSWNASKNWIFDELVVNEHKQIVFQQAGIHLTRALTLCGLSQWYKLSQEDGLSLCGCRWYKRRAHKWLPRALDRTPCAFFIWDYVKDWSIQVASLPTRMEPLKQTSADSLETVAEVVLRVVWQ